MDRSIQEMRSLIAETGAKMFTRRLTDSAGGNISVRLNDVILMTPRYAGSQFNWRLSLENILVLDLQANKIEGLGEKSREYQVHFRLLTELYPAGTAVIHGHALNALVFCAARKPIPAILDDTDKFGEIGLVPAAPAHSPELAENILEALRAQEDRIRSQAAAVLAPRHGVFVLAKDLPSGYDTLERIDVNAYCVLMGKLLEQPLLS